MPTCTEQEQEELLNNILSAMSVTLSGFGTPSPYKAA